MDRNLDGVYFRVKRGDRWGNVCFSDMTPEEREEVIGERPASWWRSLACILADTLKQIGDQLDLMGE